MDPVTEWCEEQNSQLGLNIEMGISSDTQMEEQIQALAAILPDFWMFILDMKVDWDTF